MKKINVLVLITVMDRAGAETMMMNYLRNINREKIHMDFLINREQKADYEDEIEKLGTEVHYFPTFDEIENFLLANFIFPEVLKKQQEKVFINIF